MGIFSNIRDRVAQARQAAQPTAQPQYDAGAMAQQSLAAFQAAQANQAAQQQAMMDAYRQQQEARSMQSVIGNFTPAPAAMRSFEETYQPVSLEQLQATPGYQNRLNTGQQALERSASARGTLLTGGTLKGLERFAQDYAANEYAAEDARRQRDFMNRANIHFTNEGNRFNSERSNRMDDWGVYGDTWQMGRAERMDDFNIWNTLENNYWNRLFGLGQMGYGAAGALAGGDTDLMTGMGNAAAAGTVAGGNAWGNAIGNIGNQAADAITLSAMLRQQQPNMTPVPSRNGAQYYGMPGPVYSQDAAYGLYQ